MKANFRNKINSLLPLLHFQVIYCKKMPLKETIQLVEIIIYSWFEAQRLRITKNAMQ